MRFTHFLLLLLFALPLALSAQSKSTLEKKRKKLVKEIETTNRLLKKTTQNKAAAYDHFVALQTKIKQRENLIQTLTEEIEATEDNLVRTTGVIASLSEDIKARKQEYGHTLRTAYRFKSTTNPLLFILSAESLNQAFRRLIFLRQYHKHRKLQSDAISFTRRILAKKLMNLEEDKGEKEKLLNLQSGQKLTLTKEMVVKDKLVTNLKSDEQKLKQNLKKKEKAFIELNKEIERIIQAEVKKQLEAAAKRKAQEEARKKEEASAAFNKPRSTPKPSAAQIEGEAFDDASKNFMNNRGRLPLPVESGFIARSFGMNPHPTITNIKIPNNGIDIRTDEYAMASAVFSGDVVGVTFVPGHDYTVIIQHGKYFTVYSNLQEVEVKKGDKVQANAGLGRVSMNPVSGTTELHFEVWLNKERLNPSLWLRR